MILRHNNVEILHLADGDRGAVLRVVALDGRCLGRAAITGELFWHAVAAARLRQAAFGGLRIALLREEKGNRLAHCLDSTLEIAPLALDLEVGLVHPPADPHRLKLIAIVSLPHAASLVREGERTANYLR